MASDIERRFDAALMDSYRRTLRETGYEAKGFLAMFHGRGGLRTAQDLLHMDQVTDGYTAIWERDRLDLTIEALVLQPEWKELFNDEERAMARRRLEQYGYKFPATTTVASSPPRSSICCRGSQGDRLGPTPNFACGATHPGYGGQCSSQAPARIPVPNLRVELRDAGRFLRGRGPYPATGRAPRWPRRVEQRTLPLPQPSCPLRLRWNQR
jgi:hypothetical protein